MEPSGPKKTMKTPGNITAGRKSFKRCPLCQFVWPSRDRFLADPQLTLIGYQVNFPELTAGFFLFDHSCRTTLSVEVGRFRDLYNGPIFSERATGTEECPEYCLRQSELRRCPTKCECAYVREVMQIIRKWPRSEGGEPA